MNNGIYPRHHKSTYRSNLIYRLRRKGYSINTREKTIYLHKDAVIQDKMILRLIKEFGFDIQLFF